MRTRAWRQAFMGASRWECGRGRPRTAKGSASAGCADVPVRDQPLHDTPNADEDVRAPPKVRRLRGARTSPPAIDLCTTPRMRTRTSAHLPRFGVCGVRGRPRPQLNFARRPECGRGRPRTDQGSAPAGCADVPVRDRPLHDAPSADEDVRAPTRVRRLRGARTSPSAVDLCTTPRMRTRTSAHRPGFGVCGVRGRPRPRSTFARRPECGRGRPRTAECGRGCPRTARGSWLDL